MKGVERVPREREPRAVYEDNKLREYNKGDAECYQALREAQELRTAGKKARRALDFVGFAGMEGDQGLVVAEGQVRVASKSDWTRSAWSIDLDKLREVTLPPGGAVLPIASGAS